MKIAWALILALLPAVGIAAQDRDQPLIANERALQDSIGKADESAFSKLVLLSDGVWTSPTTDGFVPVKLLASGLDAFHLQKWEVINPRVTWLDANSAIVLSAWSASGTFGDRPVPATTLSCTVWTKREGKWVAVLHQESELRSR
jgi:hypothetical protein